MENTPVCLKKLYATYSSHELVGVREYWHPGTAESMPRWSHTIDDKPLSFLQDEPKQIVAKVLQTGATYLNVVLREKRYGTLIYHDFSSSELQPKPPTLL